MTAPDRIRQLAALLDGTGIALLELTTPDGVIRLHRGAGAAAPHEASADAPPAIDTQPMTVRAPAAGVFRTAHPTLDMPLAAPGRPVAANEAVGLVQVGALLLHVVAPADGVVHALLAADGDLVGYGTPLLHLEVHG